MLFLLVRLVECYKLLLSKHANVIQVREICFDLYMSWSGLKKIATQRKTSKYLQSEQKLKQMDNKPVLGLRVMLPPHIVHSTCRG